jgi:hypothetical protein
VLESKAETDSLYEPHQILLLRHPQQNCFATPIIILSPSTTNRHDTIEAMELEDGLPDEPPKILKITEQETDVESPPTLSSISGCAASEAIKLKNGLPDESTTTLKISEQESDVESPPPTLSSIPDCAAFTRRKDRYTPAKQYRLKNSLLAGVGYLELANAGDFAANVWNTVPVPHFAAALMAVGGTFALSISLFAFRDAELSRRNILILRKERRYLQTQKSDLHSEITSDMDSQLNVNFRELGTELVDRIGMDIVMGFGAVMVGIGTFLAIGGANPEVFRASNLLSGYIGNAPVALYGVGNAAWSAYVWRRAHRHGAAGAKELKEYAVECALKRRVLTVKTHAAMTGVAGVVAGAASLVTATLWYGYPILVPCIIFSILGNYVWRNKIGYDRPLIQERLKVDKISLIEELKSITCARKFLE